MTEHPSAAKPKPAAAAERRQAQACRLAEYRAAYARAETLARRQRRRDAAERGGQR